MSWVLTGLIGADSDNPVGLLAVGGIVAGDDAERIGLSTLG